MDWPTGLAAIAVLISIGGVVYSMGYNGRRLTEQEKVTDRHEDSIASLHEQAAEHERSDNLHFKDMEVHWSTRERNELTKKLDAMATGIQELLKISLNQKNDVK